MTTGAPEVRPSHDKRLLRERQEVIFLDVQVGDILQMKKSHPCGEYNFLVLRVGMDFKIKCVKCGRQVMLPRAKVEKNIKKIIRG